MDFYTAVLYLILLSDHNDNFRKYNPKIVTDYSFKDGIFLCVSASAFVKFHPELSSVLLV